MSCWWSLYDKSRINFENLSTIVNNGERLFGECCLKKGLEVYHEPGRFASLGVFNSRVEVSDPDFLVINTLAREAFIVEVTEARRCGSDKARQRRAVLGALVEMGGALSSFFDCDSITYVRIRKPNLERVVSMLGLNE